MSFVRGYGGSATWIKPVGGSVTLCVGLWTLVRKCDIDKRSHAGTGGLKVPIVGDREHSGTIELPFDDEEILEPQGLVEGATIRIRLKIGSSTKHYETYATVESISYKVDNASGAVWQVLAWQGASALLGPKS